MNAHMKVADTNLSVLYGTWRASERTLSNVQPVGKYLNGKRSLAQINVFILFVLETFVYQPWKWWVP
jgi:hypothetical protein